MTKRTADELHCAVAKARLRIKKCQQEIEEQESVAGEAEHEAERAADRHFCDYEITDPDTLKRYTFVVTLDKLDAYRYAEWPQLGTAQYIIDLEGEATEAIDESLQIAQNPGYAAAVDGMVALMQERWRKCIAEKMYKVVFPGGSAVYFADYDVAQRYMHTYQTLADRQWQKAGLVAPTVPASAFRVQHMPIEDTWLTEDYKKLYTPGRESIIRSQIEHDARRYFEFETRE